jgi:hypothetical protein
MQDMTSVPFLSDMVLDGAEPVSVEHETWLSPESVRTTAGSVDKDSRRSASDLTAYYKPLPPESSTSKNLSALPPRSQMLELAEVYFARIYQYIPVIHKGRFMARLEQRGLEGIPSVLLFALAAVTAQQHLDKTIQQQAEAWYDEAKAQLSEQLHSPLRPLETLQAALLLIYQSITYTDFSTCWLLTSEAWRKAVLLGCPSQDAGERSTRTILNVETDADWIECEEMRRLTWGFFIQDRNACFPIGAAHTVNDQRLGTNLPMPDDIFQNAEEPSNSGASPPMYSPKLENLLNKLQESIDQGLGSIFQYTVTTYALLGQVVDLIHSIEYDFRDHKPQFEVFAAVVVKFRAMLPRAAVDLFLAKYDEFSRVIWLNVVMNLATILIHFRPVGGAEELEDVSSLPTNWAICVHAARSTVKVLRAALLISSDFVSNVFLYSPLLICARVLLIEHKCPLSREPHAQDQGLPPRDPTIKDDIEMLVQVFRRYKEMYSRVGAKFWRGIAFYAGQTEEEARIARLGGARDLFRGLKHWAPMEAESIQITP